MPDYDYDDIAAARMVLAATSKVLQAGGWQTGAYGDQYDQAGPHDLYGAYVAATCTTDACGTARPLPWRQDGRATGLALQALEDAAMATYHQARENGRVDGPETSVSLAAVSDRVLADLDAALAVVALADRDLEDLLAVVQ